MSSYGIAWVILGVAVNQRKPDRISETNCKNQVILLGGDETDIYWSLKRDHAITGVWYGLLAAISNV